MMKWTIFLVLFLISQLSLAPHAMAQNANHKRTLDLSAFSERSVAEIYDQFPMIQKGTWTLADLDRILLFLASKGEFESLEVKTDPENNPGVYRIDFGRLRRISKITFQGLETFSETQIRNQFAVYEKNRFDPSQVRMGAERIRRFYENQGFRKVSITVETPESAVQEIDLVVVVRERSRTQLASFSVIADNPQFKERVQRFLDKRKGNPLLQQTLNDLRSELRPFLSENRFYAAALNDPKVTLNEEETEAYLEYTFERSDEYYVDIIGNQKLKKSEIFNMLDLDNYSSSNPNLSAEVSSRVRTFYLSQGFARVEVSAEEKQGSRPHVKTIAVNITEGPRIEIRNIEIRGRFSQSADFYRDFIFDHSSDVVAKGFYVKEDIDAGLQNLINDRLNNGFLKARIVSSRFVFSKDRNSVSIVVQLDEGPLTQIQKVSFQGNNSFSSEDLLEVTGLQQTGPLRLNQLSEAIIKLRQHYLNIGFLEYALTNEKDDLVTYNEDNSRVQVNFRIAEGPQIFVGSIFVDGNTITQDRVILKELEFKVGDVLTPAAIEESISRLQRLGHFSQQEIKTLEEKTSISRRTVIVRVTDRDPGLLNVGVGMSNESGITFRGYLGLGYRNIGGSGRELSSRIDAKYNVTVLKFLERKIALGYLEPYLFDTRTRGRVSISRATRVSETSSRKASEENRGTGSLEQDINSHWLVVWDVLSLATIRDFNFDKEGQEDEVASQTNKLTSVTIGSTALTTDIDFRDHPFNPTSGTFTRLNLEYGSPALGSTRTIEYMRSLGSMTHYTNIAPKWKWVWANSARLGYLKNLSNDPEGAVPFDKKGLVLGGVSSVRGFNSDEAFLNKGDFTRTDFGSSADQMYALRTSASMYLFKTELRFPVYGNFAGAVFADFGGVRTSDTVLRSSQDRTGAGIAARYVTPVGAVSLEYAWKIGVNGDRNEAPSVFHFSIGTF